MIVMAEAESSVWLRTLIVFMLTQRSVPHPTPTGRGRPNSDLNQPVALGKHRAFSHLQNEGKNWVEFKTLKCI